jgi:hypothetical protein
MYDLSQVHKEVRSRLINELRGIFKFFTIESLSTGQKVAKVDRKGFYRR